MQTLHSQSAIMSRANHSDQPEEKLFLYIMCILYNDLLQYWFWIKNAMLCKKQKWFMLIDHWKEKSARESVARECVYKFANVYTCDLFILVSEFTTADTRDYELVRRNVTANNASRRRGSQRSKKIITETFVEQL